MIGIVPVSGVYCTLEQRTGAHGDWPEPLCVDLPSAFQLINWLRVLEGG
jgi:hypothetical protein